MTHEQARLNNTAVQLEKMFGLDGMARPEASLDDALGLYDDVLQKADMDWGNISEEELVQLEKAFGITNPFGRKKSTSEQAKKAGVKEPTGSFGSKKETPNQGFGAQGRARRDAREKKVKDAATAKRASSESPARRRAARAENIKRAPGRAARAAGSSAKDAGSRAADAGAGAAYGAAGGVDRASSAAAAGGRAAASGGRAAASGAARGARAVGRGASKVGQAVEPAGMQRRRGGGPKPTPSNRQQRRAAAQERSTPASASRLSRAFGATKRAAGAAGRTAKEMGSEFNAGLSSVSPSSPLGTSKPSTSQPKQQPKASTENKPKFGESGYTDWKAKMAMSKSVVSLQKFLDNDCGCGGDTVPLEKAPNLGMSTGGKNRRPSYVPWGHAAGQNRKAVRAEKRTAERTENRQAKRQSAAGADMRQKITNQLNPPDGFDSPKVFGGELRPKGS